MKSIRTVAAIMALSFIGVLPATAQERVAEPTPVPSAAAVSAIATASSLIGKWKGTWEAGGRSQGHGDMEVEFQAGDGEDNMTGRMRATYVFASPCSDGWRDLTAVKRGGKVSVQYYLGGRCGNVVLDLTIDPKKDNLLSGTYVSESPGSGTIRLKKQ